MRKDRTSPVFSAFVKTQRCELSRASRESGAGKFRSRRRRNYCGSLYRARDAHLKVCAARELLGRRSGVTCGAIPREVTKAFRAFSLKNCRNKKRHRGEAVPGVEGLFWMRYEMRRSLFAIVSDGCGSRGAQRRGWVASEAIATRRSCVRLRSRYTRSQTTRGICQPGDSIPSVLQSSRRGSR